MNRNLLWAEELLFDQNLGRNQVEAVTSEEKYTNLSHIQDQEMLNRR